MTKPQHWFIPKLFYPHIFFSPRLVLKRRTVLRARGKCEQQNPVRVCTRARVCVCVSLPTWAETRSLIEADVTPPWFLSTVLHSGRVCASVKTWGNSVRKAPGRGSTSPPASLCFFTFIPKLCRHWEEGKGQTPFCHLSPPPEQFPLNSPNQLFWPALLDGSHRWRRSGWFHVYRVKDAHRGGGRQRETTAE